MKQNSRYGDIVSNSPYIIADKLGICTEDLTNEKYILYVENALKDALKARSIWPEASSAHKNLMNVQEKIKLGQNEIETAPERKDALVVNFNQKNEVLEKELKSKVKDETSGLEIAAVIVFGPLPWMLSRGLGALDRSMDFANTYGEEEARLKYNVQTTANKENLDKQLKNLESSQELIKQSLVEYNIERENINKHLTVLQAKIRGGRCKERLFGAGEALAYCAQRNEVTVEQLFDSSDGSLQKLVNGTHNLADLEQLVKSATDNTVQLILDPEKHGDDLSKILAMQAFVCHVVISHLDFFVMQAQENALKLINFDPSNINERYYPTLQKLGANTYNLNENPQNLAYGAVDYWGEGIPTLDFSFLRDYSQGSHMQRLDRAFNEVDKYTKDSYFEFQELAEAIRDQLKKAGVKEEEIRALDELIRKGDEKNEQIRERMEDVSAHYADKRAAREQEDKIRTIGSLVAGAALLFIDPTGTSSGAIYGLLHAAPGATVSAASAEALRHLSPAIASNVGRILGHNASASLYDDSYGDAIERLGGRLVDVETLKKLQQAIPSAIAELNKSAHKLSILQDRSKLETIAEGFIAKKILNTGKNISQDFEEQCRKVEGIESIDEFLLHFDPKTRLGEALQNFCFGYADSNDLSVILTESNSFPEEKDVYQKILYDYVEGMLKPNIGFFCEDASKIDLIYQANLTGLGTHFHIHRNTIRGENDRHTQVLFADYVGVKNEIGELTMQGAYDVRKLFQYYMHRHGGGDFLTDEHVQDGIYGQELIDKRVSVLSDDEIQRHVHVSKIARGIRQSGPEISDLFVRICGYEYEYPQTVNSANKRNIMADNPASPAAYTMVNEVIKSFMGELSMGDVGEYRKKVGNKLDNLIAQTFMDFFAEIGHEHVKSMDIFNKRNIVNESSHDGGSYSVTLDRYSKTITEDAINNFPKFLDIYAKNLEKTLEHATEKNRVLLEEQIAAVKDDAKVLNPNIIRPKTYEAKIRAVARNHSFGNTNWKLGV